jgi:uracil-DNA glycosylase family 4
VALKLKLRMPLRPAVPVVTSHLPLRRLRMPALQTVAKSKLPTVAKGTRPSIMIVLDPIITDNPEGVTGPATGLTFSKLKPFMEAAGLKGEDIVFVSACMPVDEATNKSEKKLGAAIKADREEFVKAVSYWRPKVIVAMGKSAARQVMDKAVKITKIRGIAVTDEMFKIPVLPTLGIHHVSRVPEHADVLSADLRTVVSLIRDKYTVKTNDIRSKADHKWCTDLSPYLGANKPKIIGLDIEGSSFGHGFPHWYNPHAKILTVQIATAPGKSVIVPIDYPKYPIVPLVRQRLVRQLRQLLQDPEVECVGHNLKFDIMQLRAKLGIRVANYKHDTILLVHALNENLLTKGLDDVTRIYLPEWAGYKDDLIRKYGDDIYERMHEVEPDDMLGYGCPDSDVALQLALILDAKLKADPRAYNCYTRVTMPAQRAFCDVEEPGLVINRPALSALYNTIAAHQATEERRIKALVPPRIAEGCETTGVGFKLTRPKLLLEWLFTHPDGLKLKPMAWTKSGEISVSTKTHLTYYKDEYPIVSDLIDYVKNEKLKDTFIGLDEHVDDKGRTVPKSGFWQYITRDGRIHPSYLLFVTVTGRSASRDPNGQNFPKRAAPGSITEKFVKAYRSIFEAPPGYCLIECDLSQIELRVAGMLANEPTFLNIYRSGGDIHCATAAVVMGITLAQFMALKKGTAAEQAIFKMQRFRAKAVNFGFIYGMGWKKFRAYAKTDYNINLTEEEAKDIRRKFFSGYSNLPEWHQQIKDFVKKHKFVRALDGRVRHLPAVMSDDDSASSMAERQAINSPVQGFASDLGLMAIARMNAEVPYSLLRVIGFVHDAIVCIAPLDKAAEACRTVKRYMETNPLKEWFNITMSVPIVAEASVGLNLNAMHELDDKVLNDQGNETYSDLEQAAQGLPRLPRPTRRKLFMPTARPVQQRKPLCRPVLKPSPLSPPSKSLRPLKPLQRPMTSPAKPPVLPTALRLRSGMRLRATPQG